MRTFIPILWLLSLLGGSLAAADKEASVSAATPKKPNILYLLTDEWRGTATGYEGDPNAKILNLDRLAKEGLNFNNAVSAPSKKPSDLP